MLKRLLLLSAVAFALVNCGGGTRCFAEAADVSAQFKQADGHRAEKEYSQAEAIYKAIVQDYPGSDEAFTAQRKLIILYMAWDKQAKAEAAYEQLVSEFGGREDLVRVLLWEIAGAFREAKEYESAKKVYECVLSRWPTHELALISQTGVIKCYLGLRDDANAAAALAELFKRFSGHEKMRSVVHDLAFEYRSMRKWAESRDLFRYFLEHWPDDEGAMKAQRLIVKASIRLGDDPNADVAIEKLIEQFEDKPGIVREMSEVANDWEESSRYEKAIPLYKYVVDTWPESEQAMGSQVSIAKSNIELGRDGAAKAAVDKLIADFSDNNDITDVIHEMADECLDAKKYEMARELYKLVVDKWPKDERAMWSQMSVALVSVAIEDEAGAEAAIEKVRSIYGGNEDAAKVIGPLADFCRYLLGIDKEKKEKATVEINKLLSDFSKGDGVKAVDHMGDFYRDTNKYDKAVELFEYAADKWFESEQAIESQTNAVKVYISIGDEPNAQAAIDKLIAKFGGHANIAGAVAQVAERYLDEGSVQKAYEKYKYILEHWPDSERAIWSQMGMVRSRIRGLDMEAAGSELWDLLNGFAGHKDLAAAVHEIVEEYRNIGAYEEGRGLFKWLLENWPEGGGTMLELQVGIALQSIRLRELDKADAAVAKLIADYNDHPNLGKGLFQIAEEYYMEGFRHENQDLVAESKYYFAQAVNVWGKIIADMPESEYAAEGSLHSGDACCRLGEYDKALWLYQHLVDNWPQHEYAPHAQFLVAHTCQDLINRGIMPEAEAMPLIRQAYERILTDYADSGMAERAKRWFRIYGGSSTGGEK